MPEAADKEKLERLGIAILFLLIAPVPVFMAAWDGFMPPLLLAVKLLLAKSESYGAVLLALINLFIAAGAFYLLIRFTFLLAERLTLPRIVVRAFFIAVFLILCLLSLGPGIYARFDRDGARERLNVFDLVPEIGILKDKYLGR